MQEDNPLVVTEQDKIEAQREREERKKRRDEYLAWSLKMEAKRKQSLIKPKTIRVMVKVYE